jgi:two-component system alkaline phosphatase synthesis response regulator PhoP
MGDSPSRRATVLIIEDDDRTASELHSGLSGAGYVVLRAISADAALLALESTPADLILLSLLLPDTDGLILCSKLTANFPIPIIALTGSGNDVDRALALHSGAVDCITRPVDAAALLAQVNAVVAAPRPAAWGAGARLTRTESPASK